MESGNPAAPVNAIPPSAMAVCQIRFVAGSDYEAFLPAIQAHLVANGYDMIEAAPTRGAMAATRTPLDDPWLIAHLHPWLRPQARSRRFCLALVGRSPMMCSRTHSACPQSGFHIPTQAVASTRLMNMRWGQHFVVVCG